MKKIKSIFALLITASSISAHNIDVTNIKLREWKLDNHTTIIGSFLMLKNNDVYIEKNNGAVVHYPLSSFSEADKKIAQEKYSSIEKINSSRVYYNSSVNPDWKKTILVIALLTGISLFIFYYSGKKRTQYVTYFLFVGGFAMLYSFKKAAFNQLASNTSPGFIDSAFAPFKPNVITSWDNNYFYVESKGIPTTHEMMAGISNHGWQQQVPIPQCYFLPNAWPIPLNPVMAASPIPVDSIHFTRGAIAIAANGIPIFNVHTNTGVDSYLDGQLDNYGGHCGRADDYHYHIAPLHLYSYTSTSQPIAFGLDGFAVYGNVEPDGSAMLPLDVNHGHYGTDGVYHYHGTSSAPYMIAQMAGQVTEDGTHQLIPQAAAHPIRPSRTPLTGALITSCVANANNNGYTLTYTKSGQTYQIDYNWDAAGNYTFHYISPTGTLDSVYHGFIQCDLPTGVNNMLSDAPAINIFPNPTRNQFELLLSSDIKADEVKSVSLLGANGQSVFSVNRYQQNINTSSLPEGVYYVLVKTDRKDVVKKLVIQ